MALITVKRPLLLALYCHGNIIVIPTLQFFRTTFIMVGAILKESYCNRYFECAKNLPLNIIRDALTGPSSYHEYTGVNYYFAEQQRFIYSN
jgi:hypothetical protein